MALPPAPFPWTFRPGCPSYATFDRPPYSRLVVMVRGTPHISSVAPHFASFGEVEEIWGAHTDLNHCLQGPVFVKFARSSQALRALEAFRGAPLLAFPRFDQMYLAQSRVPGKPYELDTDLQKLTVIHVTVPRSFTENVLANKFKVYGVIVSCVIIRIEFGKSKDLGYVGFSVPSEAALAIEECDKSFEAVWAEAEPDPPKHPFLRFGVYGAQQRTAKHEIEGATLNTMCKNTSLANDVKQPSKVSESKSPVNNPKQKTPCNEAQESSVDTLGKSTSLAKVVTEPSKLSASTSDVNNSKSKTSNEVQKSSVHTSGKDAKWVKSAMKPEVRSESKFPVNNPKHQTTSSDIQGSKLNTFSKDTKWIKSAMKPVAPSESKSSVNNPKHKTTSNEVEVSRTNSLGKCTKPEQQTTSSSMICTENKKTGRRTKWDQLPTSSSVICTEIMQWSNLIPVVSRITLNVPVTRTESEPGGKEQNAITHRTPGSNLILLGSNPGSYAGSSSRCNIEKKGSRTCKSNLITVGSVDNATSSEPAVTAPESSVNYWVNRTEEKINVTSAKESNLIPLDYHASEVQQVFKPPEHSEYKYYVDSTDHSAALSEPSMQSPGSNSDYYYYTSGVEQQTDDHNVKGNNVMTSGYSTHLPASVTQPLEPNVCPIYDSAVEPEAKDSEVQQDTVLTTEKSLKSSEWRFYMGGARRKKRSPGNSLLTSVDPPDLASVERYNSRKQESISRYLLMVSELPLAQEQIFGLFDVIPGLESCEARPGLQSKRVYAIIKYRNVASAVYAKKRLRDVEYPLGNQLHITYIEDKIHGTELLQEMATQLVTARLPSLIWDNNWAPQLLKSAESSIPPPRIQTDAVLPSYKKKAPPDSSIREKLLIIFDPRPLPQNVLDNVLSRFGNFIASRLIPGKNEAYAMFAERASASDVIATLHGKTVNDVKLKVTLSDLPTEDFSKRQRLF